MTCAFSTGAATTYLHYAFSRRDHLYPYLVPSSTLYSHAFLYYYGYSTPLLVLDSGRLELAHYGRRRTAFFSDATQPLPSSFARRASLVRRAARPPRHHSTSNSQPLLTPDGTTSLTGLVR